MPKMTRKKKDKQEAVEKPVKSVKTGNDSKKPKK